MILGPHRPGRGPGVAAALLAFAALCTGCQSAAVPLPAASPSPTARQRLEAADALFWSGAYGRSEAAYRRLAANDPHADAHLAVQLAYESRFVDAVAAASAAVSERPDSEDLARLTRALDWSDDVPAAVAAGARAVATEPVDPVAFDFYGEALSDAGRYDEAAAELDRAERIANTPYLRAEAAREWSNYYRDRGQAADELNYVEISLKQQPDFPERTLELAREYFGAEPVRTDDARSVLDRLVAEHPGEPAVISSGADAAFMAGDFADSERYYRAALAGAPGDPEASLGLAEDEMAYGKDGAGARQTLLAALREHPDAAGVYGYLKALDQLVLSRDPGPDLGSAPAPPGPDAERRAAYGAVNADRKLLNLPPMAASKPLEQGAEAHAYYVLFNWGSAALSGLGIHVEQSTRPGFTGQYSIDRDVHFGYRGYQGSEVINHTYTATAAVGVWVDSVYHRYPLLGRESNAFGYAEVLVGSLAVDVMDVGIAPPGLGGAIVYPYGGQSGVPPAFTGNEIPDPAPNAHYPVGYPITVEVGAAQALTVQSQTLVGPGGVSLPLYVDRPGAGDLGANELALVPQAPLAPGTTYQVHVRGLLDGRPWSQSWSFTTSS